MEVQVEYFPPKEDIILQNEGAADVYLKAINQTKDS